MTVGKTITTNDETQEVYIALPPEDCVVCTYIEDIWKNHPDKNMVSRLQQKLHAAQVQCQQQNKEMVIVHMASTPSATEPTAPAAAK